jgi:acyl-coenzyme A synthetase/AMP-(fatty) acid ligase
VTGLTDPHRGEIIVAFLTPKPGANIDAEAILAHCRMHLSRYKVPDQVRVCAALPLTPTGKLMRRELKAIAAASPQTAK